MELATSKERGEARKTRRVGKASGYARLSLGRKRRADARKERGSVPTLIKSAAKKPTMTDEEALEFLLYLKRRWDRVAAKLGVR